MALSSSTEETLHSLGLLMLRAGGGVMLAYGHGWSKLMHWSAMSTRFGDPLHVGHKVSLALSIFAELFCAVAVAVGIAARAASIPVVINMFVAAFLVDGASFDDKQLALLYLLPFATILLTGPGRFCLDRYVGIVAKRG
jgi:putative oxidoreductase